MSIANLLHTCPTCGAEESLDCLVGRMVDDDEVRLLVRDVLTCSLQLGSQTLRYMRLHKPAKHRLRLERVRALLAELVPDMQRLAITRKGRDWAVPLDAWKAGFEDVFEAAAKGTLKTPLEGNGYLYEVLLRRADRAEARAETQTEADRRSKAHEGGAKGVAELLVPQAASAPAVPLQVLTTPPPGYDKPSPMALRIQAANAARKAELEGGGA